MSKAKHTDCLSALLPVRDALDVVNGKWKLLILISISSGNHRFREIERSIPNINSKVLAKVLKDLEQHELIKRTVYDHAPVIIEYTTTDYARSLGKVVTALRDWGNAHRKKIMRK
jgi:DNA-binding HxlR family transcriptional regulator